MRVKVNVLYFASIREKLGRGAEELELPAGVATLELDGRIQRIGGGRFQGTRNRVLR